jgi:hypothetical protein
MSPEIPKLLDFIPLVSPHYQRPDHMVEWCEHIERCLTGGERAINSYPIRHFKTQTTIHGIVWLLCKDPTIRILYMVRDFQRAQDVAPFILEVCAAAKVKYGLDIGPERGTAAKLGWLNTHGGGVTIMSAQQSRQGSDVDVLIVDDPIGEQDVKVKREKDFVDEQIAYYTARVGRPGRKGSVLMVMSRWDIDDPAGRRVLRLGWREYRSPAIIDEGLENERAFCPWIKSLEDLKQIREEYREQDPSLRVWHAQFQQDPQAPGLAKFKPNPARWKELPPYNYRIGYGIDMAFTTEVDSDFFAIVAVKYGGMKMFVQEIARYQLEPYMIKSVCKAFMGRYGFGPFFSYVSGPEKGFVSMLRQEGIPVMPMLARYNKLVRAEKTIVRWNGDAILLPEQGVWIQGALSRFSAWRGYEKAYGDDEIDALVSVSDGLVGSAVAGAGSKTLGRAYPGLMSR